MEPELLLSNIEIIMTREHPNMPTEIVLLTGGVEGEYLANVLGHVNPELSVICVETEDELREVCLSAGPDEGADDRRRCRLIAYCTDVIVPQDVLDGVASPAYNFHPGPPEYPGSSAASFAIYDGAETFGVCAHEMQARVDSGAIVGVDAFDIPENARFIDLEILAYKQMLKLFQRLAPDLAGSDQPLPPIDAGWGKRKTSKADVRRMKELTPDMSEDEIRLRWRAFG